MAKYVFSYRYRVVDADDMEAALTLATGCPAPQVGGGVEVGAAMNTPTR